MAAAPSSNAGSGGTPRPTAKGQAMLNAESAQTIPRAAPGATAECPKGRINIGIFFDGTGNNNEGGGDYKSESETNVVKLHKVYERDGVLCEKAYFAGVGSVWWTKIYGGFTGAGGKSRIKKGYDEVVKFFNKNNNPYALQKVVDCYGFSRGAAQARDFVNRILQIEVPNHKEKPTGKEYVVIDPELPPIEIPIYPRMPGVKVRFLGIFDTVASFGIPGNNTDVGYNFYVNGKRVERTAHAIAEDEWRTLFPLQSIKSGKNVPLPGNMVEKSFPGAHSDVGGGYAPEKAKTRYYGGMYGSPVTTVTTPAKTNHLSRIPLKWMYDQSKIVGVESGALGGGSNAGRTEISPELANLYNNRGNAETRAQLIEQYAHDSRYIKIGKSRTIYYQAPQPK
jgi:hypothetical protein